MVPRMIISPYVDLGIHFSETLFSETHLHLHTARVIPYIMIAIAYSFTTLLFLKEYMSYLHISLSLNKCAANKCWSENYIYMHSRAKRKWQFTNIDCRRFHWYYLLKFYMQNINNETTDTVNATNSSLINKIQKQLFCLNQCLYLKRKVKDSNLSPEVEICLRLCTWQLYKAHINFTSNSDNYKL